MASHFGSLGLLGSGMLTKSDGQIPGFFGEIVDEDFFDRKTRNECVPTILTRRDASFWRGPVAYWSGFSRF